MALHPDYSDILAAFAAHGVEYLVVGGYAVIIVSFALSATLVACSAGTKDKRVGDGGVCGMITECGGDVVGTWELESMCFDNLDALLTKTLEKEAEARGGGADIGKVAAACTGTIKSADVTASGTYKFAGNGDVTIDISYSIAFATAWSVPCMDVLAPRQIGENVVDQCNALESFLPDKTGPCKLAESCACISTVEKRAIDVGRYRVLGGSLEQADTESPYCVRGDALRILRTSAGATGTLTFMRK